jgi:hypothetical protein
MRFHPAILIVLISAVISASFQSVGAKPRLASLHLVGEPVRRWRQFDLRYRDVDKFFVAITHHSERNFLCGSQPPSRNRRIMKLLRLALGLLVAFGSTYMLHAQTDAEGGMDAVDVVTTTATIRNVDLEKRKVTLLLDDGKTKTVVSVGKTGEAPSAAGASQVSVAAKGAKPGAYMVDTSVTSGKVLEVDPGKHKVTLEEPNGKKKTVKVSKKITNLDQLKVGESIDIAFTESLAIDIEK